MKEPCPGNHGFFFCVRKPSSPRFRSDCLFVAALSYFENEITDSNQYADKPFLSKWPTSQSFPRNVRWQRNDARHSANKSGKYRSAIRLSPGDCRLGPFVANRHISSILRTSGAKGRPMRHRLQSGDFAATATIVRL